jgi:hypothetical protein
LQIPEKFDGQDGVSEVCHELGCGQEADEQLGEEYLRESAYWEWEPRERRAYTYSTIALATSHCRSWLLLDPRTLMEKMYDARRKHPVARALKRGSAMRDC